MQRVATELHQALEQHPDVELDDLILRSTWRWTHVLTAPFLARSLWQIRRKARRGDIDAVLFSSMVTASLAVALQPLLGDLGIPMAAIVHGRDVTLPFGPYQAFLPRVFDALDAVLPVSRATGAECLERGLPDDKLRVIPNGVDLGRFAPLQEFETMRRTLRETLNTPDSSLPDDVMLLCSVGRQVERKGFAWFVDQVMPLLPEDVHYWLAGDGPESETIRAAIELRGLDGRVRLLGRVSEEDLSALYRGADLFVMPNIPIEGDMEGFGVVMLEAGLSGLPAVASRLEGIQDVITENENGHLIESGDAWAFSEAIMNYYHDRPALEDASLRAAEHTEATFCWAAIADRYVDTVHELAAVPTAEELEEVSI